MSTKLTNKCLEKAADDEPIFVLRAQDIIASSTVKYWALALHLAICNKGLKGRARHKISECSQPKIKEALELATKMEQWPNKKIPD